MSEYFHALPDSNKLQCDLCPRYCKIPPGERGLCYVRGHKNNAVRLLSYGKSSGFCIDPIEKKPLNHFLPGTPVLSFGTAGCNLACKFCQNWDISKSRQQESLAFQASPEQIASAAHKHHCRSVAYTYNDPVIFLEYAIDTAQACHQHNIKNIAVTAGYICEQPREVFFAHMDATNIDLKAFSDSFYHKLCGAHLQPVLETLQYVKHETQCWLEITTLLIPGENDSDAEIHAMTGWIAEHLGVNTPLHFSAFHPDWKMRSHPPTPKATLQRARNIALTHGLQFVYTGNVHDRSGDTTFCPECGKTVIVRDWYKLLTWNLNENRCNNCGALISGVFEKQPGTWGPGRLAIKP